MLPSDLLTVLALIRKEVGAQYVPTDGARGDNGEDGVDGKDGRDGLDGNDGMDGVNGTDGRDGVNGIDGLDGDPGRDGKDGITPQPAVSVREAWVDPDDGHLYVELTNSRLINAGMVKGEDGKDGKPGKDGRSGVIIGGGGSGGGSSSGTIETFETVSKNLSAIGAVMGYSGDDIVSVTYSNGIVKTLAYSLDGLSSVTLSGNTPIGVSLVKTFNYSSGSLSGFTYS